MCRSWFFLFSCVLCAASSMALMPDVKVVAQEDVYSFVSPNNGSGPMWSYGCTSIARLGKDVVLSQMETGEGVPLLCNTRWLLRKRVDGHWPVIAQAGAFRQREPASLATLSDNSLFLYVNDSIMPPGTQYGACNPHLLHYTLAEAVPVPATLQPEWDMKTKFTDHSYRGYAADRANRKLMMLNIDADTGVEHWCWLSESGQVLGKGKVAFPIRSCYPQLALCGNTAHVLAVGDIVEPVQEWREYKFAKTQQHWDYVFRRIYYAQAADLTTGDFAEPIEITNVDATGGATSNQDLWIAPDGAAFILYTQREVQSALLRDKFFPGKSLIDSIYLAVVRDGKVVERRTLLEGNETGIPAHARFHQTPDGQLYALVYVTGKQPRNELWRIPTDGGEMDRAVVPFSVPFTSFMLATVRAGNAPSKTIDVLGNRNVGTTLSYARIDLE